MTVVQLTERKNLYRRFRSLSEEDARQVLQYIDDLEGHVPNAETIRAIEESLDPENLTECRDLKDMFEKCGVKCCD